MAKKNNRKKDKAPQDRNVIIDKWVEKLSKLLRIEMEDCAYCCLNPMINLAWWTVQLPLTMNCKHRGGPPECFFKKNVALMILAWSLTMYIALDIFQMLHQILTEELSETVTVDSKLECIPEVCFAVAVLFIHFFRSANVQWKSFEYEGMSALIENKRKYGFKKLLDDRFKVFLYLVNVNFALFAIGFPILSTVLQNVLDCCPKDFGCSLHRHFMTLLQTYIQLYICLEFTQCLIIYAYLQKKCHTKIKNLLQQRLLDRKHIVSTEGVMDERAIWKYNKSTRKKLGLLQNLHSAVMLNVHFHNEFFNPMYVFWLSTDCGIMIFNLYLLVYWLTSGNFSMYYVYCTVRNTTHIYALVIFYALTSYVENVSDDIVSYLFRFPISKLNAAEAAQVEMIIHTFSMQRPTLTASQTVTLNTRIIASIAGTVITYVLVIIQFQASWTKSRLLAAQTLAIGTALQSNWPNLTTPAT